MTKRNKISAGTQETRRSQLLLLEQKVAPRATKYTNMDLNGSFLTPSVGTIVSTVSSA